MENPGVTSVIRRRASLAPNAALIEALESRQLLSIVPVGVETQVNTFTTSTQSRPVVAMDSSGDYVAVWQSLTQDGDGWGIFAQLYNSAGTRKGSEFQVNVSTATQQDTPSVAMDSAGDFVITWQSGSNAGPPRVDNAGYDIYARRYNANGVAQGSEFLVNTYTSDWQTRPAVAMDSSGDFVVTWLSYWQYTDHNFSTYFQRYNAAGVAQGSETRVATSGPAPSVGMDSSGNFTIDYGSAAEQYSAAGAALRSVNLSSVPSGSVAMDPAGDFVVASSSGTQRFNAVGVAQGSLIAAGGTLARAAMDNSGDFTVTWQANDASALGVFAQSFNAAGVAQTSVFQVNTYTAVYQNEPGIAMDATGDFVIAWQSSTNEDGNGYGIFSQRYSASPGPVLVNLESTALNVLASPSTPLTQTLAFNSGIATLTGATVKITGNYQNGQDQLGFVNMPKISGAWNASTGTLTLTGTDNFADYMSALRSVTYHNTSATPNTSLPRTISYQATDAGGTGNSVSRVVNVLASSAAPVLSGLSDVHYVENGTPLALSPGVVITDANNLTIFSATVSFTNWQGEDRLSFTNTFGMQHSLVQNLAAHVAILTITGADTEAHYQAILRTVVYSDASDNPVTTARVATIAIDNGVSTVGGTENVTVAAVNDAPVVSGIEATVKQYNALGPAAPITSTLLLTDADNATLVGATVQISNYQNGGDVLTFANTPKITGTFNGFTGKLTLSGTDTVSNYRAALRSVMFFESTSQPTVGTRTISFQANDGQPSHNLSNLGTRTISVLPTMLSGVPTTTLSFTENGAPLAVASSVVVQPANSQNLTSATIKISGNYVMGQDRLAFSNSGGVTASFDATTGTLTLTGTKSFSVYQSMLQSVTYRNISDNPSTATRMITMTAVDDVGETSNPITRQITVTAVNDPPVLSAVESTALSYSHGSAATAITSTLLLTDADDANLTSATVKITSGFHSATDVLQFANTAKITATYNAATGVLTLTGTDSISDYRTALRSVKFVTTSGAAAGTRTISFQANDGHVANNLSNIVTRNITVT